MKLLKLTLIFLLIEQASGFEFLKRAVGGILGATGFFRGARKSVDHVAVSAAHQMAELRKTLDEKIVPKVEETLTTVKETTKGLLETAKQLESRLEQSLDQFDDAVEKTFIKVDNALDIIITVLCIILFCLTSVVIINSHDNQLRELLYIVMGVSLLTALGVLLRMFYSSVLKVEFPGTFETLLYTVVYPLLLVVLWKCIRLLYFAGRNACSVVDFFIRGPKLIIYITMEQPVSWVWKAYKLSPQVYYITIALPWLTLAVAMVVCNMLIKTEMYSDEYAFGSGLFVAYLAFYAAAVYLHINHYGTQPTPSAILIDGVHREPEHPLPTMKRDAE